MMLRERILHRAYALPRRESRKLIASDTGAVEPTDLAHQLL